MRVCGCVLLQVVIPVSCIHIVKKQNTALLVPNALSIRTTEGDKVRVSPPAPHTHLNKHPDKHIQSHTFMFNHIELCFICNLIIDCVYFMVANVRLFFFFYSLSLFSTCLCRYGTENHVINCCVQYLLS